MLSHPCPVIHNICWFFFTFLSFIESLLEFGTLVPHTPTKFANFLNWQPLCWRFPICSLRQIHHWIWRAISSWVKTFSCTHWVFYNCQGCFASLSRAPLIKRVWRGWSTSLASWTASNWPSFLVFACLHKGSEVYLLCILYIMCILYMLCTASNWPSFLEFACLPKRIKTSSEHN